MVLNRLALIARKTAGCRSNQHYSVARASASGCVALTFDITRTSVRGVLSVGIWVERLSCGWKLLGSPP